MTFFFKLSAFVKFVIIGVVIGFIFFASCSNDPLAEKKRKENESPIVDRTLRLSLPQSFESEDPLEADDETSGIISSLIFRRLYNIDRFNRLVNDLAGSETVVGNHVYLSFVAAGKLSIKDALFCLNRLKRSVKNHWILNEVSAIQADNKQRLVVVFRQDAQKQWPIIKARLAMPQAAIYDAEIFLKSGRFESPGLYQIVNFSQRSVLLRKDDKVVLLPSQMPEKIFIRILKDFSTNWFFLKKGLLDVYEAYANFSALATQESQNNFNLRLQENEVLTLLYAALATPPGYQGLLSQVRFRHWLNLSLDRKKICAEILAGNYNQADFPVPPSLAAPPSSYYERLSADEKYNMLNKSIYSLRKAHFDEKINIYTSNDYERQTLAQLVFNHLRQHGFQAQIHVFDLSTITQFNNKRLPGIYFFKWIGDYPHAENFLYPLFFSENGGSGGNRAYVSDAVLDNLLQDLSTTARVNLTQLRIQELAPWIFFGFARKKYLIRRPWELRVPVSYMGWPLALQH